LEKNKNHQKKLSTTPKYELVEQVRKEDQGGSNKDCEVKARKKKKNQIAKGMKKENEPIEKIILLATSPRINSVRIM